MESGYRSCTRCLMDTSDPEIQFDEQGVCNHCHDYDRLIQQRVLTGDAGRRYLEKLVKQIKAEGQGRNRTDKRYGAPNRVQIPDGELCNETG